MAVSGLGGVYGSDRARHRRACDGFATVVKTVGERWCARTRCSEWDDPGSVEHVIGFR
jgi:hypothetical protein